jgi:multicomponent Na+:H+ antiporter subunit B
VTRRTRIGLLAAGLAGLAALLGWAVAGLPAFGAYRGPYGFVLDRIVLPERHTTNVVMAVTFDVRGIDTMGEELILYAAVLGVVLLLRARRGETGGPAPRVSVDGDAVRLGGAMAVGAGALVALWLVAFGYVTPGGGFQGGVALAGAVLLVYLVGSQASFSGFGDEKLLDPLEAVGAGGYVAIGVAALASGGAFLTNLLGPGSTGTLLSGGSIPLLNWAAAVEVAAANLVLCAEFLRAYSAPLPASR